MYYANVLGVGITCVYLHVVDRNLVIRFGCVRMQIIIGVCTIHAHVDIYDRSHNLSFSCESHVHRSMKIVLKCINA
jgi:hypothetical protein